MDNPHRLRRGQSLKIPRYEVKTAQKSGPAEAPVQVAQKLEIKVTQPETEQAQLVGPEVNNVTHPEPPQIAFTDASAESILFNKNRPAFTPVIFVAKNGKDYPVGVIQIDFDETQFGFIEARYWSCPAGSLSREKWSG